MRKSEKANAQVAVEVKSGVEANVACGFAKGRGKGEEVREADFPVAIKVCGCGAGCEFRYGEGVTDCCARCGGDGEASGNIAGCVDAFALVRLKRGSARQRGDSLRR